MRQTVVLIGLVVATSALAQSVPREPPPNDATAAGMLMSFFHSAEVVAVVCAPHVPQMKLHKVIGDWRTRNAENVRSVDIAATAINWYGTNWQQLKAQNALRARLEIGRMMESDPKEWCAQVTDRFQAKEFDLASFPEQLKLLGIK